ncbi:MAG: OPT/YSL family transporter, partial [Planctomycetota bacterium]
MVEDMSGKNEKLELIDGEVVRRGPYPEFTWVAIFVGWIIGTLIAFSISYAALKLGFSIEGSELAAILGWGILRGLMGRTSILENNINQTVASAVNGASSGIMFSVPALFILNRRPGLEGVADFSVPLMIFACIAGAFIGLAFVIPLRKQMIDFQRLPYPGGIAVATILKSPGAGITKAMLLFGAAIVSAVFTFFVKEQIHDLEVGKMLSLPPRFNLVLYCSLMTIGVGFLSGKGGFWFGAGGFICYWLLSPIISLFGSPEMQTLVEMPGDLRTHVYKPSGIGMLIGAALGGIIMAFPLIKSAIGSLKKAGSGEGAGKDEMPIGLLVAAVILGALCLIFLAYKSVPDMSLATAVIMSLLGTLWIWIAGVIVAECIGRTNWSPLSGMTLIAITILIVIAVGMGMEKKATIVSCLVVGAAICLAISQASDMMLDLKSGYLVGGVPKRQQIAQFVGAWLGPIVVFGLLFILEASANAPKKTELAKSDQGPGSVEQADTESNSSSLPATAVGEVEKEAEEKDEEEYQGIGSEKFPAAQASALASVIEGLVEGNVPTYRYTAAGILGFLLAASGLGGIGVMVALGFYMPFNIVL